METIRTLCAQYFQLVEVPALFIPPGEVLIQQNVQTALYERMFDESLNLPPATYRTRVLKEIIARIESSVKDPEEDEILDDLMTSLGSLLAQPKPSALQQAQQLSHVKYTAPLTSSTTTSDRTVTTIESRGLILSGGTTGNRTWEAALHLGSFLATEAGEALVRNKRVIELGAGTGFLSLFCARHLGVRTVVSTDREPVLIDNIRECAILNRDSNEEIPIYPAVWNWGTPLEVTEEMEHIVEGERPEFEIALGADLIYDTDLVPLLLSTVRDLFDNYHVGEFIISATMRNEKTFQTFLTGCETNSFKVECIPFQSTAADEQSGFFHSTSIPIKTYRISRAERRSSCHVNWALEAFD
ncbi:hypothetical protein N7495_007256 [Penicillium taxi]|uniref:uncharacterized protein n=1 Tax=Penicillium taxi TaxID=168475 RepID=UPI002545B849|nr:uncharacterized protein N7495_007256 [Penicillium taxi]KAJ5895565.1 hypothetical protein N7495_007256 [Penicillium taxi]